MLYFREAQSDEELIAVLERLRDAPHVVRYSPRFIIVSDYQELLAFDTKSQKNLIIPLRDIAEHFTFFLPWTGMEKAQ